LLVELEQGVLVKFVGAGEYAMKIAESGKVAGEFPVETLFQLNFNRRNAVP